MAHIQHLARKRPTVRFFGTECKIADMAHESIERQRIDAENALLRAENADLRRLLAESIQCLHAAAAKLSEHNRSHGARTVQALTEVDSE